MVIAATGAVFIWAGLIVPASIALALSFLLGWTLLTLALVDLVSFRLPDVFTLPLIAAGLAAALVLPGAPILDHLAGGAAGWSVLAALAFGYRRLRGTEGIGMSDAKLLAAGGAWLGWRPLPSVLLIACAAAFAWIAIRALTRGRASLADRLAFGAPLCLAVWIVWLHGAMML